MNACQKTGFNFAVSGREEVAYTGDLFILPDRRLQIRGIPADECMGVFEPYVCARFLIHAVIAPIEFIPQITLREPGTVTRCYVDTVPGVVLVCCTDQFREHVKDWSPSMLYHLPKE